MHHVPSTHLSDLLAFQDGARLDQACAAFHARYRDLLFGWCRRRHLSADDSDDLTQDVLLKLFTALRRGAYDPAKGSFRGWLKTVVHRAITDHVRKSARHHEPVAVGGTSFHERLNQLISPEAEDELSNAIESRTTAVAAEIFHRVRSRTEECPWQAFYQTMVEGRPTAEVAAALGITIGAVHKAKRRVKQKIEQEYLYVHPDANSLPR